MQWVDRIHNIKILLIVVAVIIAIASLLVSNYFINDLKKEEAQKMDIWAEAMRSLNNADEYTDLNLVLKVINGNNTIPVIVLDKNGNVQTYRNLDVKFETPDSLEKIKKLAAEMINAGNSIRIYTSSPEMSESDLMEEQLVEEPVEEIVEVNGDTNKFTVLPSKQNITDDYNDICYDDSLILRRLAKYPYIQLVIIIFFVVIAIFALFSSMKAEQNKVWVGLSKETAHQLGTPISSLIAWTAVLKETYPDDALLPEMENDVHRLELIAERFSKIGSLPELKPVVINELIERVVKYMDKRTSNKVAINVDIPDRPIEVNLMSSLFEWVMENLCKNAVDAMNGAGKIDIRLTQKEKTVVIDVSDNGKGIQKSHFRSVFTPGFTTKKRGWGLGLSLAKRIVEEYHKGKIYVKSSELGKGTTFRIELKN